MEWFSRLLTVLATTAVVAAAALVVPTTARADGGALANAGLETVADGLPGCWQRAAWGEQQVTWSSTADAHGGTNAQQLTVTGHVNGDAKLLVAETTDCAPTVVPGTSYTLSAWYRSTSDANHLTVFRHSGAGWTYWADVAGLPAADGWSLASGTTPPVPDGTDRLSFGISLSADGTLVTDDYWMAPAATAPPAAELTVNPGLEGAGADATPEHWFRAGWGDAQVTAATTNRSHSGSSAYRLTVSGRTYGDSKLLPEDQAAPAVQPGVTYRLSVWYTSTSDANHITLFSHTAAGWGYWTDLAALPAADDWTAATVVTPPVPAGTDALAWGVSLAADGTLVTDDYSTTAVSAVDPSPTGPSVTGQWVVQDHDMTVRAMHATLLKTGKVLLIAGSGNSVEQFAAGTFRAALWDPVTDQYTTLAVPKDMFCAGHVTLPDGRILIQGGTKSYPTSAAGADYGGLRDSWIFDPDTEQFTTAADANEGHWYPTLTELGNGDVWMAGGLKEDTTGAVNTEMWDTATSTWRPGGQVPQSWSFWGLYPHMFLMADGRLFYSGGHVFGNGLPGTGASIYRWQTGAITDVPGLRDKDMRDQSASVLLPPAQDQKVLITGGGNIDTMNPAVATTDVIDLNAASPAYTAGPDLPGPGKMYLNATILPDRTVLVSNGGRLNRDSSANVFTAAVYDPASNAWTSVAADPIGRNYHSTAVLLPDGRVAVFGSNPGDGSYELRVSVYSPPYLFRTPRPVVSDVPQQVGYGDQVSFGVGVGPGATVRWAQLMRPMSVTHQMDSNMRLVDLPITVENGTATVSIPSNNNLLPPGPYLLSVTDSRGVPSTGSWVMVR